MIRGMNETYPADPRYTEDVAEHRTDYCRYCGAEKPISELVICFQDEICCADCLISIKTIDKEYLKDDPSHIVTPIKIYDL